MIIAFLYTNIGKCMLIICVEIFYIILFAYKYRDKLIFILQLFYDSLNFFNLIYCYISITK